MPDTIHQAGNDSVALPSKRSHPDPGYDFAEVTARIGHASDGDAIWDIISEVCEDIQVKGACCRCFPSNAAAEPEVFFSKTPAFDDQLEQVLQSSPGYLDAFLHASVKSPKPFRWREIPDILNQKSPQIDSYSRKIAPMGDGVVVPVFGPLFRNGYFVFQGEDGREFDDEEMLMLHSISQTAYLKLCDLMYREEEDQRSLSVRELEIINMIARGHSNQSVAESLKVSINTINTYMKRIFEKLDVSDRVSAVMRAYALGYIA